MHSSQAFINTARKIYEKIEQGVFDVSNEVPPGAGQAAKGSCDRVRVRHKLGWSHVSHACCSRHCKRAALVQSSLQAPVLVASSGKSA